MEPVWKSRTRTATTRPRPRKLSPRRRPPSGGGTASWWPLKRLRLRQRRPAARALEGNRNRCRPRPQHETRHHPRPADQPEEVADAEHATDRRTHAEPVRKPQSESSGSASRCLAPPSAASLRTSARRTASNPRPRGPRRGDRHPPFAAITIPFSNRPSATTTIPGRRMLAATNTSSRTYEATSSPRPGPPRAPNPAATGTHWRSNPAKARSGPAEMDVGQIPELSPRRQSDRHACPKSSQDQNHGLRLRGPDQTFHHRPATGAKAPEVH
jgi:hypothetical protein